MDEKTRVVIDAGHGGERDPGAVLDGRQEKNDNLRLALAVGNLLEKNGIDVVYTRVDDRYDTPFQKAEMANQSGADYFISLHRNAAREPGQGSGTMTLVYEGGGTAEELAAAINQELSRTGFTNLGIFERPDLIVLRKTQMPSVLVETGFIDNPQDNRLFDEKFDELAAAIATGILNFIALQKEKQAAGESYYMVQTGVYRVRSLAEQQLQTLQNQGYPAFLVHDGTYYRVRVGAFRNLDNAVRMEQALRQDGYNTVLVYEREVK